MPTTCHSERSEESSWISAPVNGFASPAGFFAALRITSLGKWSVFLTAAGIAFAQERPSLLFREDWKEIPPVTPVTQEHVANPDLIMSRHGPAEAQIRKSHHDKPADDPFYIWSGECE